MNKYTEWCLHCEHEVELSTEMKAQKCPNCGKYIAPCGMCDCDTCECSKCELSKECIKLNKRKENGR